MSHFYYYSNYLILVKACAHDKAFQTCLGLVLSNKSCFFMLRYKMHADGSV